MEDSYYQKYLKYKTKYQNLKLQFTGMRQNGGGEKTTIYLFKADWCGHCQGFKPTWEEISKELKGKYEFVTYDADKDKEILEKWNIQGFPTIIKKTGDKAEEYIGERDKQGVIEFIKAPL